MLSGFDFFRTYSSVHWHFTSAFDVLKYGCNSRNLTLDNYKRRRDKMKFDGFSNKLNDERTAFYFCVANFVHNKENWFYDGFTEANSIYTSWRKYYDAFQYNFKSEFKIMDAVLKERNMSFKNSLIKTPTGANPPLLQLLLHGTLTPEFICRMNDKFDFLESWYNIYTCNDPFVESKINTLRKYQPLVMALSKELGN